MVLVKQVTGPGLRKGSGRQCAARTVRQDPQLDDVHRERVGWDTLAPRVPDDNVVLPAGAVVQGVPLYEQPYRRSEVKHSCRRKAYDETRVSGSFIMQSTELTWVNEYCALPNAFVGGQPCEVDLTLPRRGIMIVERYLKHPALVLAVRLVGVSACYGVCFMGLWRCLEGYLWFGHPTISMFPGRRACIWSAPAPSRL